MAESRVRAGWRRGAANKRRLPRRRPPVRARAGWPGLGTRRKLSFDVSRRASPGPPIWPAHDARWPDSGTLLGGGRPPGAARAASTLGARPGRGPACRAATSPCSPRSRLRETASRSTRATSAMFLQMRVRRKTQRAQGRGQRVVGRGEQRAAEQGLRAAPARPGKKRSESRCHGLDVGGWCKQGEKSLWSVYSWTVYPPAPVAKLDKVELTGRQLSRPVVAVANRSPKIHRNSPLAMPKHGFPQRVCS